MRRSALAAATLAAATLAAATSAALALAGCSGSSGPPVSTVEIVPQRPITAALAGRGVAWYRSDAAWERFWTAYDGAAVDRDLARAKALGFDTVRIFLQPDAIGFPQPRRTALADIDDLLRRARAHGVRVDVALFDRFSSYADAAGSSTQLRALLPRLSRNPAVAFVEPRNEIDPRNPAALAWLAATIREARRIAPGMPLVASTPGRDGVAGIAAAARALGADRPDAWAIHWYGEPAQLPAVITAARAAVAPLPVVVGEVGYSTWSGDGALRGVPQEPWAQEAVQEQTLLLAERATRDAGLPPPTVWQLTDIRQDAIPASVGAHDDPLEQAFGLFRLDGSQKPAAAALQAAAAGDTAIPIGGGFETGGPAGDAQLPAYWRLEAGGDATFTRDPAVHRSGAWSARIDDAGRGGDGRSPAFFENLPALAGHRYALAAWALGQHVSGSVRIALGFYAADGTFLAQSSSSPLAHGTSRWRRLSVSATAPARTAMVRISLGAAENAGTVWFDDVEVAW